MREARLEDFGPYRIVRRVAVGGMAEIYLARQRGVEGMERTVILKRILARYAHDAEFVTMFLDEARLLAALSHPHIAQVFDVGHVEDTYYLVMEHVRGPTLGKLLAAAREASAAPLPRREALGIGLAIAEALHYVHERRDELGRPLGIVHRDLNPANVMLSYDGGVKLIDFGIAKAATKVYETRTGVIKGTYGYIAPEQLVGTTPVDHRADVFALGILLYEMCVGVHPYDVSDEPNLIDRILQARYRRPREVRGDIPPELDELIAACLAPHPEGRPEDMASMIEALATHLGEQRMVPTQTALAALARRLVPDDEGPRPLKRLTAEHRRPFGGEPSGTRKVRLDDDRTQPTRSPGGIADDPWAVPTVRFVEGKGGAKPSRVESDSPIEIDSPLELDKVEEEELPTTLMAMSLMGAARTPRQAIPVGDSSTWVPLRTRARRFWGLVLLPLAGLGLVGAGLLAFLAARALGGPDPVPAPPDPPRIPSLPVPVAPVVRTLVLRVVSEPPGARVYVDGQLAEGVTPLLLSLPADSEQIWLRLASPGYLEEERRVQATIGQARFVLSPLPLDGGQTDAGAASEDPPPVPRAPRRRRVRRR